MIGNARHAVVPSISIAGAPFELLPGALYKLEVERRRNMPGMCTIVLENDTHGINLENPAFRPGAPITVSAFPADVLDPTQMNLAPIFTGEIVAMEAEFSGASSQIVLRCYDKLHRLHRTRNAATFEMQPLIAIVSQIAGALGLPPECTVTTMYTYHCQRGQTDWEFLSEIAREVGAEIGLRYLPGGAPPMFVMRPAGSDPAAGLPQNLMYGETLIRYRPRITSAEQSVATATTAWDSSNSIPVVGVGAPLPPENMSLDPSMLPIALGGVFAGLEATTRPLDQTVANTHAMAAQNHAASLAFEAEGTCHGNPAMVPGGTIVVSGCGLMRYNGSFTLSAVTHRFDSDGYHTDFEVSGVHDRSELGLVNPGINMRSTTTDGSGGGGGTETRGPMVGIVTDNNDVIGGAGRVKVQLPGVGPMVVTDWAPVLSIGGGIDSGFFSLPQLGDQVLVVFEQGDIRKPFVLGGIHSAIHGEPGGMSGVVAVPGVTAIRRWKTLLGQMIEMDETPGAMKMTITTTAGHTIELQDLPETGITITTAAGSTLSMKDLPTPAVEVATVAGQKLSLTDAPPAFEISDVAGNKIASTPAMLSIEAVANLQIKANGIMSLQSTGPMNVQGTPIKLN